ncbi:Lanosterol 14-alpha demethylase [Rhynchospora pubera]|uniref:Lanosterol 14-alpha demethylase n=1 Tax=Rhynchospora pubera TaxID=906938 RepID=A0AAV8GUN8_9POAL|nr:Lanosterol 14-alpha demethylase [Rhynchospora pubera]
MVYILVLAVSLILATFLFLKNSLNRGLYNSTKKLKLPPVVKAWPLVGALYMLGKDPVNLIKNNYQKYGSVFTIKVLGQSVTLLIGPEVSRHFYTASESELSLEELYKFAIPMFGRNVAFGAPTEIRLQQTQFLLKGLRPQMLRFYVGQIVTEVEWQDSGTIDLVHGLEHLITLTTARCLLGREVRENLTEEVSTLIRDLAGGVLPISVLFPYLPIPAHNRRDRARDKLLLIFSKIISLRKTSPQPEEDLLQTLLESRYNNGESITNEQVSGMLSAILFVGKHTLSNTAAWTGAYLLQHKTYFSKVLEEQKALLGRHGLKMEFDILREMDVLSRCIKEAARIGYPPIITPRYCRQNFTVTTKEGKEYTIPKGHIVLTSPAVANRADHVFKDPDRYDPDRYLSAEEKKMASQPFSYITFGGGRHTCPGEAFTFIMLKTIWSYLIRNFELELVSTFHKGEWNGKEKILVHYKRRQLSV